MDITLFNRHWLIIILTLILAAFAIGHAVVSKRDVRSAIGWVGLVLALPFFGALFYFLFGVNRLRKRATNLRAKLRKYRSPAAEGTRRLAEVVPDAETLSQLRRLSNLIGDIAHDPLCAGNLIVPLPTGRQAYDQMLGAIGDATRTIMLSTYIFDNDKAGQMFCKALGAAVERGVEVRVLIDGVGERYSRPSIVGALKKAGVNAATFLGSRLPWWWPYFNLRNHRKLLIVDGTICFTGGMNIRIGHLVDENPPAPVEDVHFRVEGPVVATLREIFAEDWTFVTDEELQDKVWFPPLEPRGKVIARSIPDGPDHYFQHLTWTLMGALACARESVRIVTPYFVPETALSYAIATAARRGVKVEIILPENNNLRLVQWASTALLWHVLEAGCEVYMTRPLFDHTKLMVVDGAWSLIGSANWDARSLRLNFELNLEAYSQDLAQELSALIDKKLENSRRVTLEEVDGRPLSLRLRDGTARLLAPYL